MRYHSAKLSVAVVRLATAAGWGLECVVIGLNILLLSIFGRALLVITLVVLVIQRGQLVVGRPVVLLLLDGAVEVLVVVFRTVGTRKSGFTYSFAHELVVANIEHGLVPTKVGRAADAHQGQQAETHHHQR